MQKLFGGSVFSIVFRWTLIATAGVVVMTMWPIYANANGRTQERCSNCAGKNFGALPAEQRDKFGKEATRRNHEEASTRLRTVKNANTRGFGLA